MAAPSSKANLNIPDLLPTPGVGSMSIQNVSMGSLMLDEAVTEMDEVVGKLHKEATQGDGRKRRVGRYQRSRERLKSRTDFRKLTLDALNDEGIISPRSGSMGNPPRDTRPIVSTDQKVLESDDRDMKLAKVFAYIITHIQAAAKKNKNLEYTLAQWLDLNKGQKIEFNDMSMVQLFGLIDDDNSGTISGEEVAILGYHMFELNFLRRNLPVPQILPEWSLDLMLEIQELSYVLRNSKFDNIDLDKDQFLSEDDLTKFLKKKGGRPWKGNKAQFGDLSIQLLLGEITKTEFVLDKDDAKKGKKKKKKKKKKGTGPKASKEDFFWWQESMMPHSSRNVVDLLQNAIEVDVDRWPIVEDLIPNIKGTFRSPLCGKRDQSGYHRLTRKGAKVVLDKLRGNQWGGPSETKESDNAIRLIEGMTLRQFKLLAEGCPVKIWQRLIDADYNGEDDTTMDSFMHSLKLEVKQGQKTGLYPTDSTDSVDWQDMTTRRLQMAVDNGIFGSEVEL